MKKLKFPSILAKDKFRLGLILLLGLVHGLIYVFLLPPWQHYDEPNHFEHVWLAAHQNRLPEPGDYDPGVSRSVLQSMISHNFYRGMVAPVLGPPEEEVKIPGYSAMGEPPLYYQLASLPLRWMDTASVESQLYAARLVSLLLFLVTILACWGAAQELFPIGHPLRWIAPLTMVLIPSFVELMTAVNNDSAAIAMASVFTWGGLRLVKRGFNILDFLAITVVAIGCYLSKNTALLVVAAFPFVILFALFRGRIRRLAWAMILVAAIAGVAVGILADDAAYWHRAMYQLKPARIERPDAVLGSHVLMVETNAPVLPKWFPSMFQLVPMERGEKLAGKTVTLGMWVWASQPMEVQLPVLNTPSRSFSAKVSVTKAPQFFAMQVFMPEDALRTWVSILPRRGASAEGRLFFDGFVLAEGGFPADQPPVFTSPDGENGEWDSRPFTNLLRNSSIEQPGLRLRPRVDKLVAPFLPDGAYPSMLLGVGLDWAGAEIVLKSAANRLLTTFWAVFGWGHIILSQAAIYRWLWIVTICGLAGILVGLVRKKGRLNWELAFIVGSVFLVSWGVTMTRGFTYAAYSYLYLPVARHAYPSIVPTVFILTYGWMELARLMQIAWGKISSRLQLRLTIGHGVIGWARVVYVLVFLALDLVSILTVYRYYQ